MELHANKHNPKYNEDISDKIAHEEMVNNIRNRLKNNEILVFDMMINGMREYEIAQALQLSPSAVGSIKRAKIWPNARLVMKLEDEHYEALTNSGRIFCR